MNTKSIFPILSSIYISSWKVNFFKIFVFNIDSFNWTVHFYNVSLIKLDKMPCYWICIPLYHDDHVQNTGKYEIAHVTICTNKFSQLPHSVGQHGPKRNDVQTE